MKKQPSPLNLRCRKGKTQKAGKPDNQKAGQRARYHAHRPIFLNAGTSAFKNIQSRITLHVSLNYHALKMWRYPVFIYIPLCLIFGCLGPRSAPIVPPQIITSTTSNIPKPRLLGVNYLYCIGDADTGTPRYNRDKLRHLGEAIPSIGTENRGDKFFNQPLGIASDIRGNIYVADVGHHCIYMLDAEENIVTIFGKFGWRTGEFDSPTDVAVSFVGDEFLYVADTGNDRIQACSLTNRIFAVVVGEKSGDVTGFSRQTAIQLDAPGGIATDRNGNIYIADTGNHRMLKLNPQGRLLMAKGTYGRTQERFREPSDVAVDSRGNIYVVDAGNHRIQKFDFSGNFIEIWGEHGDQPGQFSEPRYIAIDRWDNICVVDQGNRRIQMFDTHGEFLTQFTHPLSIFLYCIINCFSFDATLSSYFRTEMGRDPNPLAAFRESGYMDKVRKERKRET